MDSEKSTSYTIGKPYGAGRVLKSFFILAVTYCLLMACWPIIGGVYSRLYRAVGNFLFGSFGNNGIVCFEAIDESNFDTLISIANTGRADASGRIPGMQWRYSTCRRGYIFAAFLTALVMATPMSVKRKIRILFMGLTLMHCFIALMLAGWIGFNFTKEPICLYAISAFWKGKLNVFFELFIVNGTFGFIVGIFIWLLITFRREDWARIIPA